MSRRSARRSATMPAPTCDRAIEVARQAGVKVSYDTNLRLRLWDLETARKTIHATSARCDILLPSLDDSQQLTGLDKRRDEIADFYLKLGAPLVALKMGSEGALLATPRTPRTHLRRTRSSGRCHRRRRYVRRRLPGAAAGRRRHRDGGPLCQCRRRAVDAGLWRRDADPAEGRGDGGDEAAEHAHLLSQPAAAVVGIDHRIVDARRAWLAARRSPYRTGCPRSGTPARSCDRGYARSPGRPRHDAGDGSAGRRSASRRSGRSSCRRWRATSFRSAGRPSGSARSRPAARRRSARRPPAPA